MNPQAKRRWEKFKTLKRGYYSFIAICILILLSLFAELIASNRPLIISYNDSLYFPSYGDIIPGTEFDLEYDWETDYKELQTLFDDPSSTNWLIMPLIPYSPLESHFLEDDYPPYAPNLEHKHYLGTDMAGRDILSRIIYGFRIAIFFSLFLLVMSYVVGVSIGALMGYLGGTFDLIFQRIIEILSNIPILYVTSEEFKKMKTPYQNILIFNSHYPGTVVDLSQETNEISKTVEMIPKRKNQKINFDKMESNYKIIENFIRD